MWIASVMMSRGFIVSLEMTMRMRSRTRMRTVHLRVEEMDCMVTPPAPLPPAAESVRYTEMGKAYLGISKSRGELKQIQEEGMKINLTD